MPNRLAQETSPYLQQHAGNPVDWARLGRGSAQARAREDKPILLSVGYSACHWCHVMAHESFEDPAVAAVMNRLFVNRQGGPGGAPGSRSDLSTRAPRKISRRQRARRLAAHHVPHARRCAFFRRTYFPKEPRYNLPGFPQLLERVAQIYRENREEIGRQNETILATFENMHPGAPAHHSELSPEPIAAACAA